MGEFFQAFWPNFCATVLGVILGLPVAVYVNRNLTIGQRAHEAREQRRRRDDAIDVLVRSCEYNVRVLDNMKSLALQGRVMRNADLQVTTWDAVGAVLTPLCSEPALLQQISHHWLRLHRLEKLNDEIFAREVGAIPPLADELMAVGMWGELHDGALNLSAHALELAGKLRRLQASSKELSESQHYHDRVPEALDPEAK